MSAAHVFPEMFRGLARAVSFFWHNSLSFAPNTPTRHPWRWCIFIFLDALIWVFATSRTGRNTGLVLVNRLGDAILSRDFVDSLKQKVEQDGLGELIVIGDISWEVLKDTIYSDYKIVFIDEARFRMEFIYRYRTALKIAGLGIRDCYCLMHHRLEMRDESIMSFTGAGQRIAASMPFLSDRWYPWIWRATSHNFEIVHTPKLKEATGSKVQGIPLNCAHVYHRQQAVVAALGLQVPVPEIVEASKAEPELRGNLIVLAVGAQAVDPFLPLDVWVHVSKRLSELGYAVAFSGGTNDRRFIAPLKASFEKILGVDKAKHPQVWIGTTDFSEFMCALKSATAYVGRDTGGSHLAYWLGTPCVILLNDHSGTRLNERSGDFFPYPNDFLPTRVAYVRHKSVFFNSGENADLLVNEIVTETLKIAKQVRRSE